MVKRAKKIMAGLAVMTAAAVLVMMSNGSALASTSAVTGVEAKCVAFKTIAVSWDQIDTDESQGPVVYEVYRATSENGSYKRVKKTKRTSFKNTGLAAGRTYYYKVKASDGAASHRFSAKTNARVYRQRKASLKLVKKEGAFFDFRVEAGQKLYSYDTLQGACAHDGMAYLTLYNRDVEKCKIVKIRLSTLEVVKVSKALAIYHANSLTYNTKKNLLLATACKVKGKRAVFVNPKTLKVVSKKDIKLTSKVKGLPASVRKSYAGFTAIAYNEKHNCYVGRLRNDNNVIIFNGNLKPVKYVKLKGKKTYLLNQGMESVGNYIYDVRSFTKGHKYSMVTVHTMKGKFVGQLKFPYGASPGRELQCIFHDGDQFYSGEYWTTSQYNDTKANKVKRNNKIYLLGNPKGER